MAARGKAPAPLGARLQSAAGWPDAALAEAFNAAFADYLIGPPHLQPAEWSGFARRQGVDAVASRVVAEADSVLGFALVGRHGARSRLATMGVRLQARSRGLAQQLLDGVLADAAERGDASFELEVFAQNERALALYRSRGFAEVAELRGYERAPGEPVAAAETSHVVALEQALAWLAEPAIDGLPYQVSAEALAAHAGPLLAWRLGDAQLVAAVNAAGSQVQIASLVDRGKSQRHAGALARALSRAHPNATLRVPQLQRPDLGGDALEAEGWQRLPLYQLLMRRSLRS